MNPLRSDLEPVESILITSELGRRSYRGPNHQAENEALVALVRSLATSPGTVLKELASSAMELCRAGSAGVSIEEGSGDSAVFRWRAIVGAWEKYVGGTLPRWNSPCATVLEQNRPLLMAHPERAFPFPPGFGPPIVEALLVPFCAEVSNGKPVGTVWVLTHHDDRRFDREDLRLLESLATFAAAAYQTLARSSADRR